MSIINQQIAIVGGGPGGLTLARLLQLKGAKVNVYERDVNQNARAQGATLDLHVDSGLKALEAAGLMDAFMNNYRPGADLLRIVDTAGTIVYDQHSENRQENFTDEHFRPEIDRGPLRQILLDSLQPGTVIWDSQLTTIERTGGQWQLHFKNGKSAVADLVIGADGAYSKIRPQITTIQPFYSGVTIIEGTVPDAATTLPHIHQLVKGGKVFAMGAEQTLILSAKGDGSLSFYTGWRTGEHWLRDCGIDFNDRDQLLTWFEEEFSGWDETWHQLFKHCDIPLIPRPQYCMPPDQNWTAQSDITILGDAAHLMPPYAGEGVNMAMLDALELSNCLTDNSFPDTPSAISHYEVQMRKRASAVARMTLDNTELMHSPMGIQQLLKVFEAHA